MDVGGWELDLRALYGRRWRDRQRFHLTERLYESPDAAHAVVLFAIAEIGLNKQVARLALFVDKRSPVLVHRAGRSLFWFEGQPGEPVEFSEDGRRVRLFAYSGGWLPPPRLACRPRVLDLQQLRWRDA